MRRRGWSIGISRRRRPPGPWLVWIGLFGALLAGAMGSAPGQTTTPAPLPPKSAPTGPTTPPQARPGAETDRGVIRPAVPVDPEMNKGTPDPRAFPTPVLPPPGGPGGDQRVQPK